MGREPRNKPVHLWKIKSSGKEAREYNEEKNLFSKWYWEWWTTTCKSTRLGHTHISYTKLNSERLQHLNTKHHKAPRKNIVWHKLCQCFLMSISQSNKNKINKWDLTKLTSFCKVKEIINKTKRQPTDWEKKLQMMQTGKGFIFKIYRELIQFSIKRKQSKNEQKT